ncbi:MAG TPA: phospholipase D-like domain-containing protein [Streptosporangiaceae bacterium]|nr:phospholipase D-like domain-containing protein [Streptosporangiaceae bacterium]
MTEPKCTPEYWFLGLDEEGKYFNRLSNQETAIPKSQLLEGRAAGWATQAKDNWDVKDPTFMLSAFTSGNTVTPFVDGDAYVTSLRRDLGALRRPPDFALMAGWQFTSSFDLNRGAEVQPGSQLTEMIAALAKRNVATRALAMKLPWPLPQNGPFVNDVNAIYPAAGQPPLRAAYLDGIGGGFAFSHHQKEVFVGFQDSAACCAYVGGIDLAVDRWDTPAHRKTEKDDKFFGWHDIQVRVQGNALQALWANFAERWDSANRVLGKAASPEYRLLPCPVPDWSDNTPGKHHVQVLRTVAVASSRDRERFMPYGELTVLAALAKAIRNAECYIYIEEQFLWDCELADLIGNQLKAKPGLRLIVVLAAESEFPPLAKHYSFYLRSQFLMRVMGVNSAAEIAFGRKTRVYVYGLYQTLARSPKSVYVHSKLIIIDDRYVSIGSANVDKRSMRIETELTLGIVDSTTVQSVLGGKATTVCQFAKDLRERLWKEHLNFTGPLSDDPVEALKNFPEGSVTPWQDGDAYTWPVNQGQAKKKAKYHAQCYVNIPGTANVPVSIQRLLDRSERRYSSTKKKKV